jgi:hypothetical protein
MPRTLVDLGARAWLDIGSYGRRGPTERERLSPAQVALIGRTVGRVPEVMVKVLNRGQQSLGAVGRHINYLDRDGELEIHTDEGERLKGEGAEHILINDWDLDLEEVRRTADLKPRATGKPPKLVHKLLFSMPAGTPPEKVLVAVKNFAREEFGAKYRYAMVLHTDEPHPHVHMVVKAMGYDGKRLNIRRATLRQWRREFALHLRQQDVAANATERVVRGENKPQKIDSIHRAAMRGASTHWRHTAEVVGREVAAGALKTEPGKERLLATRREVVRGWSQVADDLVLQNEVELALAVRRFVAEMPPPLTERQWLAEQFREQLRIGHHRDLHR